MKFGDFDEKSLEKAGIVLAFCELFLYNGRKNDFGGVCRWVN
jgi:hypothetical protein